MNACLENDYEDFNSKEELVRWEISKLCNSQPVVDSTDRPGPSKKTKLSTTRKNMLEFVASTSFEELPDDDLQKEIQAYFDAPNEETECLDWWERKQEIYPSVAKLADLCFGIPATSASSEEAFSVAGVCIIAKRSRVNSFTIKKQLFVHDNHHLVDPVLNAA
ncbi:uncharacterized protein LOC124419087 [Lucilia cuprina]|uniref:uncharacterized protein LOC124419087 n=1 Tax=Lucilia cuprina TaxID=7375 RepID=UPI001F059726|nr:uncharacterized protein LOC124419087 [Lucilia cuprina]